MRIEYYGLKKDTENEKIRKAVERDLKRLENWAYSIGIYIKPIPKACLECQYFPCLEKEKCVRRRD